MSTSSILPIHDAILDGKKAAECALADLAPDIAALKARGITPGLRVVLVGNDPASMVYTRTKAKKCLELGMDGERIELPEETTTEQLCAVINSLNADSAVHGILVQLPLPAHIDARAVLSLVASEKDVDGFTAVNAGKLLQGDTSALIPCTALGIVRLLSRYGIATKGADVAVIGRSDIVGKPVSALLSAKYGGNATVALCHSETRDIAHYTKYADIVIAAIGRPRFVTADMLKDKCIVVDVGINRIEAPAGADAAKGLLVGDVDFEGAHKKAAAITPVPGGVGPMTIAMLMHNTVQAARMQSA